MEMYLVVFTVLLYQACGCGLPAGGGPYYVDSKNTASTPSGADCNPFPALQQAVEKAETFSSGEVKIIGSLETEAYLTETFAIDGNITIDLNQHSWELTAAISIGGHFTLQNGKVRAVKALGVHFKIAKGATLLVQHSAFIGWTSAIFTLSGLLQCDKCEFLDNIGGIAAVEETGGELEIANSLVRNNSADLGAVFRVSSLDPDSPLRINITTSTVIGNSANFGGSVGFISSNSFAEVGMRKVEISRCIIADNSGTNVLISAESISFNISESTIQNCERAFTLSLSSSVFYISQTLISKSAITTILVVYLDGTIVFEGVNITDVASGPAIVLNNAFRDVSKAMVVLKETRIDNVNATTMSAGGLFASGFTLVVTGLEITRVNCFIACGFTLIGSSLILDHIAIHDVAGWLFVFGQIIASTGTLHDLELYRGASLGLYVFAKTFCTLAVSNLSMHDMTPNVQYADRQLYNLVVTHQFFSSVVYTNVRIRLPPLTIFALLASVSSDIIFRGLVIPRVYAFLGYIVIKSTLTVEGFAMEFAEMQTFFVAIGGVLNVKGLSIDGGLFSLGMLTTQQGTHLHCEDLRLKNVRAWSVVQPSYSIVNITNAAVSNCSIEYFAENVLNT